MHDKNLKTLALLHFGMQRKYLEIAVKKSAARTFDIMVFDRSENTYILSCGSYRDVKVGKYSSQTTHARHSVHENL
jgi:hypothetical protein